MHLERGRTLTVFMDNYPKSAGILRCDCEIYFRKGGDLAEMVSFYRQGMYRRFRPQNGWKYFDRFGEEIKGAELT